MVDRQVQTDRDQPLDQVTLADIVRFLRRNWVVIIVAAIMCGFLAAVATVIFVSENFEASATLVIVPPRFSSELKPQTLTVQGYQKLLESDEVVSETRNRLVEAQQIDPSVGLRVGGNLGTRIFVSRRSEETELAPMIQAMARYHDPDVAASIANLWVQVFMERIRALMGGTTSATVQFIDEQYPRSKQVLTDLEDEKILAQDEYQERRDTAATAWDRQLAEFTTATADLVAAHQSETRRLVESFKGDQNLETRDAQLDALRSAFAELQGEQARAESQLDRQRLQLEAIEDQLARTPQYLELRKAVTDDALWDAIASSDRKTDRLEALKDSTLVTQEVNPVFTELSSRAAKIEMEINALIPRSQQLDLQLAEMSEQIRGLENELGADYSQLEMIERSREAGLENLKTTRAMSHAILERQAQRALDGITREWETRIAQLDREIGQQAALFEELAKNFNEATLAKGQNSVEDVRLGARAVAPERSMGRGIILKSFAGLLLGGLIGLLFAVVREVPPANVD
jgi:capsular polysaccharide biosynthesis protein